jgi:ABC-type Mn2+/Zn2+ transport system ATPase subunit
MTDVPLSDTRSAASVNALHRPVTNPDCGPAGAVVCDDHTVVLAGVSISFGAVEALTDITLNVRRGELLVVAGPNGAGKTSLLMVMGGLRVPDAGTARVLGYDIASGDLTRLRRKVGLLPQHVAFEPRTPISVRRAVLSSRAGIRGLVRKYSAVDHRLANEALRETGTLHLAERPVGALSGGEKQKVLLARCLAQEPSLLLLDEPAANLDVASRRTLLELVAAARQKHNLTVVFVTHLLSDLPPSPDRVALLRDGRLFYVGTMEGAFQPTMLRELYGRPVRVFRESGQTFVHPL